MLLHESYINVVIANILVYLKSFYDLHIHILLNFVALRIAGQNGHSQCDQSLPEHSNYKNNACSQFLVPKTLPETPTMPHYTKYIICTFFGPARAKMDIINVATAFQEAHIIKIMLAIDFLSQKSHTRDTHHATLYKIHNLRHFWSRAGQNGHNICSHSLLGSSYHKNNACNRFLVPKNHTRDTHHTIIFKNNFFACAPNIWKWAWHIMGRPWTPKFGRPNFFVFRTHIKPLQKELGLDPILHISP